MSTNIEDMRPYVMPWAQGASEPTVVQALLDSSIEFCSKTHLWRDWLQPSDVTIGEDIVPLVIPADAAVLRMEEMWVNRIEIDPLTEEGLKFTRYQPGDKGAPRFYTSDAPGQVRLIPIPDLAYPQGMRARVTLIPSRTATTIPDFLFVHYAREVADGALARLHSSDEAYATPAKAQMYAAKFDSAINRGTTQAAKSNMKSRRRARAHFF